MAEPMKKRIGRKSRSAFFRLLIPLFLLLLAELALLLGSLNASGAARELDSNARDLVNQQVANRRNYIENSMVRSWSDLSRLNQEISYTVQTMLDAGELDLQTLDGSSEAAAPVISAILDDLITTLYGKSLNGVFVMFSTHDLPERAADCPGRTGIYIRDLDASSTPSIRRADLLLERAPISVVRERSISTDSDWRPLFTFTENETDFYDCLRLPYQAARAAEEVFSAADFGRWSATPYRLECSALTSIAYVQPLFLTDGTVYGVLGIELSTAAVRDLLPYRELLSDDLGSYLLGVTVDGEFTVAVANGPARQYLTTGDTLTLPACGTGDDCIQLGSHNYHARGEVFNTYSSNTPFEFEHWTLVGLAPEKELYAFSARMWLLVSIAILATGAMGFLGSLLISQSISRPIRRLSREVSQARKTRQAIPQLSPTGFRELDQFATAFTRLSQEVVEQSTTFLRIMEMASVDLGGFEVREAENRVFVTANFFSMFQMDVDTENLTVPAFLDLLRKLRNSFVHTDTGASNTLYRVPLPGGGCRYLHVETTHGDGYTVGLAEDVTAATEERMRIEHERDYDLLTGLLSRRAFYRKADELFRNPEQLRHAALVMLDLDNLKQINDRFGHDWGDKYIRQAGQCFAHSVPEETLCARVSGDEFYLFFYGYPDQESIRRKLKRLTRGIYASGFELPNGEHSRISASGGVAWYPEDSTRFSELVSYSDFAMYQVKQSAKGRLGDFDLGVYNREHFLLQRRREFKRLVDEELLNYHFQPIVDGRTGAVAAYEALMRVKLPTLRNPMEVLEVAKAEGALVDIERLTWKRSLLCFQQLLESGQVEPEALLFVNSISSVAMPEADWLALHDRYEALTGRIVLEVTEDEEMNAEAQRIKRQAPGISGMIALDDYGSGYNSELNLLALSPNFIKVDIAIIRDIDSDANKQKILENITGYAHERSMRIVVEGVETPQELETVLRLGADLIQGFFLARPAQIPGEINPAALEIIRKMAEER